MDRTTRKVLRFLSRHAGMNALSVIVAKCGPSTERSLEYLVSIGYVKQSQRRVYTIEGTRSTPDDKYQITAGGLCYLTEFPWISIDKWLTRICAVVGAVTGIAALISG